ncbi:hypothetical protein ACWGQ5_51665, partial [Streptomyces sp. NPDC055722]
CGPGYAELAANHFCRTNNKPELPPNKVLLGTVMVPMHLDRGDALADDLRRIGTIAARDAEGAAARQ